MPQLAPRSRVKTVCVCGCRRLCQLAPAPGTHGPACRQGGRAAGDILTRSIASRLQVDKVELQAGDDGLALTAAADIAAEEVVLSIPAALLFPTSVSQASPVVDMIQNATIGRISAMCLYLIAERRLSESFWAPWIRSLPTKFHHALSYSDEDMAHFQASPFKELRSRKKNNVEREYMETIVPLLSKLPPKLDAATQAAADAALVAAATAAGKTPEDAAAAAAAKARNLSAEDFSLEEYTW